MQTILGSGGAIGGHLAKVLPKYTDKIRLVSRNPEKVNEEDELFSADLLNLQEVKNAVEGSKIVYLVVGLTYDHKVWQRDWPVIMDNVIEACALHSARLVFFDNIYMYTQDLPVPITERTPVDPQTKKGKVRAQIAAKLLKAHKDGKVKAVIARAADFYGPGAGKVSVLDGTLINNMIKGKAGTWLGSTDKKHSFTFTPDAAVATALLGNTPDTYGEVWHLPTYKDPPTAKEWTEMIGKRINKPAKVNATPRWLVTILGLFMPLMRELKEMMYQYEQDYVFDSSKFEKHFMMKATPYEAGLDLLLKRDYPDSLPS